MFLRSFLVFILLNLPTLGFAGFTHEEIDADILSLAYTKMPKNSPDFKAICSKIMAKYGDDLPAELYHAIANRYYLFWLTTYDQDDCLIIARELYVKAINRYAIDDDFQVKSPPFQIVLELARTYTTTQKLFLESKRTSPQNLLYGNSIDIAGIYYRWAIELCEQANKPSRNLHLEYRDFRKKWNKRR